MSNNKTESEHLSEIEDGDGCAEIWEKLSESRNSSE